jgi:hypothetical protein
VGPGRPLRPAVIDADGSNLRPLDAVSDPELNLGAATYRPTGRGSRSRVRPRRRAWARRDLHRPALRTVEGSRNSSRDRLTPEVLTGRHSAEFLRHEGRGQPDGVGGAVRDAGRRHGPSSHHAVGVRLRRPRVVARRSLDRVPEAVRTALSGAPRWLRAPPVPLSLGSGTGALNPSWSPDGAWIVVSLQRAEESGIFVVHTRWHRPAPGDRRVGSSGATSRLGNTLGTIAQPIQPPLDAAGA